MLLRGIVMTMQSSGLKVYLIVLEESEGSESEFISYTAGYDDVCPETLHVTWTRHNRNYSAYRIF